MADDGNATHFYQQAKDSESGLKRAGWCQKHGDFAWEYDDGSIACWYQDIVDCADTSDCIFVPFEIRATARLFGALVQEGEPAQWRSQCLKNRQG